MPYLGDYLGQLLSEIALARMQADLETVRIAEFYAAHPLLRNMPVPHIRVPEIDLDIPVLVRESEQAGPGDPPRGGTNLTELRRRFEEILPEHLALAGVQLNAEERRRLRAALEARIKSADMPREISGDVRRVSDDLTATALHAVEELRQPANTSAGSEPIVGSDVANGLREAARIEALKLRTAPPRLHVLVTSSEIREAGNADNVTRLRLKVSEEGVEWSTIELDGVEQDRLVLE